MGKINLAYTCLRQFYIKDASKRCLQNALGGRAEWELSEGMCQIFGSLFVREPNLRGHARALVLTRMSLLLTSLYLDEAKLRKTSFLFCAQLYPLSLVLEIKVHARVKAEN